MMIKLSGSDIGIVWLERRSGLLEKGFKLSGQEASAFFRRRQSAKTEWLSTTALTIGTTDTQQIKNHLSGFNATAESVIS